MESKPPQIPPPETEQQTDLVLQFADHLDQSAFSEIQFIRHYQHQLASLTSEEFTHLHPEDLLDRFVPQDEDGLSLDPVSRLRLVAYFVAYQDIAGEAPPIDKQHNPLLGIQEHVDASILYWIEQEAGAVGGLDLHPSAAELRQIQTDIENNTSLRQDYAPTNLQVLTGSACNGKCFCCFIRNNPQMDVRDAQYVQGQLEPGFNHTRFFLAALYSRMNYGLNEVLFTSYGDPLSQPLEPQLEQIRIARELGFPQITLLTNGVKLTPRSVDQMVAAGLTNLTVSLHTSSPEKHNQIVMGGSDPEGRYHHQIVDIIKNTRVKHPNLTIRINVAYSRKNEAAPELIKWVRDDLDAPQITLIEVIPANLEGIANKLPLPDNLPGFHLVKKLPWGMEIYIPDGDDPHHPSFSVALCRFGNQDPQFDNQQKNIMYVNDPAGHGTLKLGPLYHPSPIDLATYHRPIATAPLS
ncbi:hypothetical protein A2368_04740 [Candidatus Collierbacteria bacterium RIFOXYB1_FULL_49_13]|uniref:Radical SAM core domain-containing protein n=1 Tax=Candidatus Collierbacteria bacterium RIFOXYB1_FULL_49_13 TaxID=1817728 RepID=A0A1F5FJQ9_9BACT|nr:MAG: hypothetical protein A2368_04740 [Candidatus Collierbacteria bacterium RIFOXYB1_FULL_49_13]